MRESSGLLLESDVELSNVAVLYRKRYEILHGASVNRAPPPIGRRLKTFQTMGNIVGGETPNSKNMRLPSIFRCVRWGLLGGLLVSLL